MNIVVFARGLDMTSLRPTPAGLTGKLTPHLWAQPITGLQNSDNISATYSCIASSSSPAGAYAIVPALVDPGNRQTNYAVSLINGALTVTQSLACGDLGPIPWPLFTGSTALSSTQLNATANVPGNFVYSPQPMVMVLNTGTNVFSQSYSRRVIRRITPVQTGM